MISLPNSARPGAPVQLQQVLLPAGSATDRLRTGQVFAVIVVEPIHLQLLVAPASGAVIVPAVGSVFSGVAAGDHVPLTVRDAVPLPAANARGRQLLFTFLGPGRVWVVARVDIDDGLRGAQVKSLVRGIELGMKHDSGNVYRVDVVPIGGSQPLP